MPARRVGVEALEPRQLLAASDPIINEFLASNTKGLVDDYGARPDWVEIYNPGASTAFLGGWHLTDDKAAPAKWSFPGGTFINPGEYLVVFADGRSNPTGPGGKLHANFSLNVDGEYLGLTRPDNSVVMDFDPFPAQTADVAYGFGAALSSTSTVLLPGAAARTFIPTDDSLGSTWRNPGFDDSGWIQGESGVGFEAPLNVNGYRTRMVDTSAGAINNIGQATALLDGDLTGYSVAFDGIANSNFINYGDGGSFGSDVALPNGLTGAATATQAGREQYALRTTANVFIPAGTWTIDVGSDAGFRLTLAGVTFTNRTGEDYTGVTGGMQADTLVYGGARTSGHTMGTITVAAGVNATMQLDYFESTGPDSLELSVASGSRTTFTTGGTAAGNFTLLLNNTIPPGAVGQFRVTSLKAPAIAGLIGTDVSQMQNVSTSAFVRIPFDVTDLAGVQAMTLRMKYDDGFVAYLNGQEIARRFIAAGQAYNATSQIDRADALALSFEDINVSAFRNYLVEGTNVLAFQVANSFAANNNLLLLPQLDVSRTIPGGARYLSTPTPGFQNTGGALALAKDTNFSVDRGYYDDPFDLVISTKQQGGVIYYTLDGRSPLNANGTLSTSAFKYTVPIHIATTATVRAVTTAVNCLPSDVDTETYLFASDIVRQGDIPNVAGFPAQWIDQTNAFGSFGPNNIAKYSMSQDVVNDPAYKNEIISDLKSIPVISIVMNPDDLFGNGAGGTNGIKGIYSNPTQIDSGTATAWERPTSAEMFFPDGSRDGFQIDAGVQIQGGASRDPNNQPKHGFRLVFKSIYGASSLNYKMFDDSDVDSFDQLILKSQFNKTWTNGGTPADSQYVIDQFASDTLTDMGGLSKHGRYVQLYLNGVYWGMYNVNERPNSKFAADYLGGEKEDYDVYNDSAQLLDGSSAAWNQMFSMARAGLQSDSAYQAFKQYLDVPQFIDYMLSNFYIGNSDWDVHNFFAVRRSRLNGLGTNQFGGFKFITFDAEISLGGALDNTTNRWGNPASIDGFNAGRPSELYQALRKNAEFRQTFADAIHKFMFNGGALTTQASTARYLAETNKIYAPIVTESARWGNYRRDYVVPSNSSTIGTRNNQWLNERNRLTVDEPSTATVGDSYFALRTNVVLGQMRTLGLYPSLNAPELNKFGGAVSAGFNATLTVLTPPAGTTIYYTLDGTDPRLPGGGLRSGALVYSGAFVVNASERVMARAYVSATQTWSALTDATFLVGGPPKLRVTEVMYNPADAPAPAAHPKDDYEFIELRNTGGAALDPSGIRFTAGIDFTFPAGSPLIPAGGRVVLVKNPAAFADRYGSGIPIAGTYFGDLADSGERLALVTGLGQPIESFTYADGWYDQTDGEGFALVANEPDATDAVLSTKDGWRSGQTQGGNPGGADAGLANNSVIINELLASATGGATNWVELRNTTAGSIDISGWYLSDDLLNRKKYTITLGSIVPANGFLSFSQLGGFGAAFALSALGGGVFLTSSDGAGGVGGYRDSVDYGASEPGVSFGSYTKSTGNSDFTAMSAPTRDAANAYPKVGPVVINEVMYNPFGIDREYVELRNITDAAVSLAGWTFADGINFTFGAGASIPAGGYVLVVPIDPGIYRTTYNIPAGVQIFGPYTGALNNGGEKLTLARPGVAVGGVTPLITVDRINYDNTAPWPSSPDGTGPSVGRTNAVKYGNDPINWRPDAVDGTPGVANANAPLVFAGAFNYADSPRFTMRFSKEVGASLTKGDLSFANLSGGAAIDPQLVDFAYDPITLTATWRLPVTIADGYYLATLSSAGVTDAQGRPLDGNADGTGGDDYRLTFSHLVGDADGDGVVGFSDLVKVAQNYQAPGAKAWADGDFDYDGTVAFSDLVAVAQHYGVKLTATGAGVAASPMNAAALAAAMGLTVPSPVIVKPAPPAKPVVVVRPPAPPSKPVPPATKASAIARPTPAAFPSPPPVAVMTFGTRKIQQGLFT